MGTAQLSGALVGAGAFVGDPFARGAFVGTSPSQAPHSVQAFAQQSPNLTQLLSQWQPDASGTPAPQLLRSHWYIPNSEVMGDLVGESVGEGVGLRVGRMVGDFVGVGVGLGVGLVVGDFVGEGEGLRLGEGVGAMGSGDRDAVVGASIGARVGVGCGVVAATSCCPFSGGGTLLPLPHGDAWLGGVGSHCCEAIAPPCASAAKSMMPWGSYAHAYGGAAPSKRKLVQSSYSRLLPLIGSPTPAAFIVTDELPFLPSAASAPPPLPVGGIATFAGLAKAKLASPNTCATKPASSSTPPPAPSGCSSPPMQSVSLPLNAATGLYDDTNRSSSCVDEGTDTSSCCCVPDDRVLLLLLFVEFVPFALPPAAPSPSTARGAR